MMNVRTATLVSKPSYMQIVCSPSWLAFGSQVGCLTCPHLRSEHLGRSAITVIFLHISYFRLRELCIPPQVYRRFTPLLLLILLPKNDWLQLETLIRTQDIGNRLASARHHHWHFRAPFGVPYDFTSLCHRRGLLALKWMHAFGPDFASEADPWKPHLTTRMATAA
eukprot:1755088-Pleurochrysis_carterae.AAC.4